jgi:acyl carrier protein
MTDQVPRQSAAALLAAVLDRPVEAIPENANIFNFPAWDSMAHTKMMLSIEDETGSMLDPSMMAKLVSLEEIDRYLNDIAAKS